MTPEQILTEAQKLMKRKRADYTAGDTHENFDRSAIVVSWFQHDIDKVFATLITTKLARLATLLSNDKEPQNEAIEDSFKDLVNYAALWGSKRG